MNTSSNGFDINRRSLIKGAGSILGAKITRLPIEDIISGVISKSGTLGARGIQIIISHEISNHDFKVLQQVPSLLRKYPSHFERYIGALKEAAKDNYGITDVPDIKNFSDREVINWFKAFSRKQSEILSTLLKNHIARLPEDIIKRFPKECIIKPNFNNLDDYFTFLESYNNTNNTPGILNGLDIDITDYYLGDLDIEIGMEFGESSIHRSKGFHYYVAIRKKIDEGFIQESFFTTDIEKVRSYITMNYNQLNQSIRENGHIMWEKKAKIEKLNDELRKKYFGEKKLIIDNTSIKKESSFEKFLLSSTSLTPISEYQKYLQSKVKNCILFEENFI